MPRPVPRELSEFLRPFSGEVRGTVLSLRGRVLDALPRFHEFVWDATNAVSLVYTPSTRWQDGVVHIATDTNHVNLGFNDGASLADPADVLEGTGARIRHVRFLTAAGVEAAPRGHELEHGDGREQLRDRVRGPARLGPDRCTVGPCNSLLVTTAPASSGSISGSATRRSP